MQKRIRWLFVAALVAAFTLVGVVPAAAQTATDNASPDKAIALTSTGSDGTLSGSTGGKFAYYKFSYPGDWKKIKLNLRATPDDGTVLKNVGFKLYGPDPGREYLAAEAQRGITPNATAEFTGNQAGEYVLQVYSYFPNADTVVWFNISGEGLPAAAPRPAAAPASPGVAVPLPAPLPAPLPPIAAPLPPVVLPVPVPPPFLPAPAVPAAPVDNSVSERAIQLQSGQEFKGALSGNPRFHYYKFTYSGDKRKVLLNVSATPNDFEVLRHVGLKVYGPDGREWSKAEAQRDLKPSATAELATELAGEYVLQVYNYVPNPDTAVYYAVTADNLPEQPRSAPAPLAAPPPAVPFAPLAAAAPLPAPFPAPLPIVPSIGASPPAAAPIDNSQPQRAIELKPGVSLNGAVPGGAGGRFLYYKFTYPGDTRKVSINLTTSTNDYAILQHMGLKLYGPDAGREYAKATALRDATPNAVMDLSNNQAGEYVVQVYNYAPNPELTVYITVSIGGL